MTDLKQIIRELKTEADGISIVSNIDVQGAENYGKLKTYNQIIETLEGFVHELQKELPENSDSGHSPGYFAALRRVIGEVEGQETKQT